jgi:hypothetical protein
MVLATPKLQDITTVEQWFQVQAESLKLLAPTAELVTVQQVLQHHLPERVQRLSRHIPQSEEASSWLKIILKSGEIIRLQPLTGSCTTVAVNCSGNLKLAQEQFGLIQSPGFCAARQDLGIDQHWFLVIPDFPLQVPKQSELLDILYAQLTRNEQSSVTAAIALYG